MNAVPPLLRPSEPLERNTTTPPSSPTPANPGKRQPAWRHYAPDVLPRLVGYGLLALFALDMIEAAAAYRPFHAEDDQALILQVLERIAVPLVAYVFVFWWEAPAENRFELRVRKLLSMACLPVALACVGLAVMAVHSGLRLSAQASAAIEQQDAQRVSNLQRLARNLPTMPAGALQSTYEELLRRNSTEPSTTPVSVDEMRASMLSVVPKAIEASHAASEQATRTARRLQWLVSGKYVVGGLICAVLFFLIWDYTGAARQFAFFGRRNDPMLTPSERMERVLDALRFIPDFNEYHWYRRIRREWQYRRDKRAARHSRR